MTNFSDYFSFENFMTMTENAASRPPIGNGDGKKYETWKTQYHHLLHNIVEPALISFLQAKLMAGELTSIKNIQGRNISFASAWNNLIENQLSDPTETQHKWSQVARTLSRKLIHQAAQTINNGEEYKPAKLDERYDTYQRLVTNTNQGEIDLQGLAQRCDETGEEFEIVTTNWEIKLERYYFSNKYADFQTIPVTPVNMRMTEHISINFSSGNLIILNDVSDITEQNDLAIHIANTIETVLPYSAPSTKKERDYTIAVANQFGFFTTRIGEQNPRFYSRNDLFISGEQPLSQEELDNDYWDDDERPDIPEFKFEHYLYNRRHKVTVIDEEQLLNLMTSLAGRQHASTNIKTLLEKYDGRYFKKQVPPGEYNFYFNGKHEYFMENFACEEIKIEGVLPYFVMSKTPLTLIEKNKPSVKPKKIP